MNFNIQSLIEPFTNALPGVLGILVLIVAAFIISNILKKLTVKGLNKVNFSDKLVKWGVSNSPEEGKGFVDTLGNLAKFIVILFFLPFVLKGLNLSTATDPITSMFDKFFSFVPNLLTAGIILFVGVYVCKFVKQLVFNLLQGLHLEKLYTKFTGKEVSAENTTKLADVLAMVVYVLLFIPILTVALETLKIQSISQPILNVLNQVFSIIPNIILALVLVAIGVFVAGLVGDLVEGLLRAAGVDSFSKFLNPKDNGQYKLSTIIVQILKAVLIIFFVVEALAVLKLEVLNNIGTSIIAYLPLVISAVVILVVAIIAGNLAASFFAQSAGNKVLGEIIKYSILVLAVFMALDQLKFAQTIVNSAFVIILGAGAVAFAIAFGFGGKDFAAKQLEKLNQFLDKK